MNLKHSNDVSFSQAFDLATKSNAKTKNIIVINNNVNNNILNTNGLNDHFLSENVNFNFSQHQQPIFDTNDQPKLPPGYSSTRNFKCRLAFKLIQYDNSLSSI